MKSIFENYLSIIFIFLTTLICCSFIIIQLQITYASEFASNAVERIQASYHNTAVIADLQEKAEEMGYELVIEDTTLDAYPDQKSSLVTVKYTIDMPLVGVVHQGEKTRFAQ